MQVKIVLIQDFGMIQSEADHFLLYICSSDLCITHLFMLIT